MPLEVPWWQDTEELALYEKWHPTHLAIGHAYSNTLILLDNAINKWRTVIRYTSLTARGDDYSTPC